MEIENKFRQRVDLQETRRQQLHYKELKKQAEMEEEEEFRKQVNIDTHYLFCSLPFPVPFPSLPFHSLPFPHTVHIFFQMLAKFAEDDRIEQMNAQRRRMKQLEHKRAVEKLIEDRRDQFRREKVKLTNIFLNPSLWRQIANF